MLLVTRTQDGRSFVYDTENESIKTVSDSEIKETKNTPDNTVRDSEKEGTI